MGYKTKFLILLSILMVSVIGGAAAESNEMMDWSYYKEMDIVGDAKYKAFYLDEEVYQHASPSLADLRVLDAEGNIVPYYIQSGHTDMTPFEKTYQSKVVHTARKNNDTIIDFEVARLNENVDLQGNILIFSLPDQSFLKHLKIEGSHDGNQWDHIVQDHIYKADHLQKNSIDLGGTYKYTFYRLTILDNAEKITLSDMTLLHTAIDAEWQSYQREKEADYSIVTENKDTLIHINNSRHLKVKKIVLDIEENFQRSFSVYDEQGSVVHTDGVTEIYNLDFTDIKIANKSILFTNQPQVSSIITIRIRNEDNPPLKINGLTLDYYIDKLVFEDIESPPYKLYYGNSEASKPSYEVELFKEHIEKENQNVIILGEEERLAVQEEEKEPWGGTKYIFNGVIVLISLLLIIMLTRKLNRKDYNK